MSASTASGSTTPSTSPARPTPTGPGSTPSDPTRRRPGTGPGHPPRPGRPGHPQPSPPRNPANHGCHGTGSFLVSRSGRCSKSWSTARPVTCEADAPRVSSGVSCWMVAMSFLAAFRTCPAGLVVGRVRRRMDRRDALQQPAGLVEAGQGSRMVGSGVVRDDRDLAGLGFSLEQVRCEDCLPGVPVLLDRVQRDLLADQRERAGEGLGRPPPVHGRSGALSSGGLHAAGPGLVLGAGLSLAVWAFRPWSDKLLTRVVVQAMRLVVAGSSWCSSNGSGRPGARPAQAREQPVGGARLVFDVGQGLHDVTAGPGRLGTRRGHQTGRAAGPGRPWVLAPGCGRVPPRPGSPHGRSGPGASWWPATRPAVPAPSSRPARPFQR